MCVDPSFAELAAFLDRVRAAVAAGRVWLTDYARDRAREELGWEQWDIEQELCDLTEADWYRCEAAADRPWEIIWTFTPPLPEEDDDVLWIRLVERAGVVVVSFHRG